MGLELVKPDYTYTATVDRVIDGDTLDVHIDVGFHTNIFKRLRLLDIDTDELRGGTVETKQRAVLAKQRLEELLRNADKLYVQTEMDTEGKYGRVLAYLWIETDGNVMNVNEQLLLEGYQKQV
jgi:micrococcal nuclease